MRLGGGIEVLALRLNKVTSLFQLVEDFVFHAETKTILVYVYCSFHIFQGPLCRLGIC
jgi:hypothetical protein